MGLPASFYDRSVHEVAPDLVGCTLRVGPTAGVIVETEAYDATDPACHAHIGRTPRNEGLFGPPGRAYIYLSYGVHSLLNAVAQPEGDAAAVLIRALEPTDGLHIMRERRGLDRAQDLCSGPGKLTQALDIGLDLNRADLTLPPFEIEPRAGAWRSVELVAGPRIGITKAVDLAWRHSAVGNRFVSSPRPAPAGLKLGRGA